MIILLMLGKFLFNLRLRSFRVVIVSKPKCPPKCVSDPTSTTSKTISQKDRKVLAARTTHMAVFGSLNLNANNFFRLKPNHKEMELVSQQVLKPPASVRGMTKLDRSKFDDVIKVPAITIPLKILRTVTKQLKKYQLKLTQVTPVVELEKSDPKFSSHKQFLMDPSKLQSFDALPDNIKKELANENISEKDFQIVYLNLAYNNWNFQEVMQAIMPDDLEGVAGFSEVGHIAHFNLREKALPFKHVIGEVLLDKLSGVKTVVNKLNTIDNTYRTFQMELLAGEDNFVTQTKENGFTFELDFSKVYWNSRLGTEHHRVVKDLTSTDIVFDVFAGIGPFSVPAAKKRATVFANDLNPYSYESLVKNIKLNKCDSSLIKCSNLDGREFIQTVMKDELTSIFTNKFTAGGLSVDNITRISILMNLPALAYTFLDAFNGLLIEMEMFNIDVPLPTVNCYCFTNLTEATEKWNGDMNMELKHRVIDLIGGLQEDDVTVRFVRDVAPQKLMMCVSFQLTPVILCGRKMKEECKAREVDMTEEPPAKCLKLETST